MYWRTLLEQARGEHKVVESLIFGSVYLRHIANPFAVAPLLMNTMFSPMPSTLFMSWVLITVVMPYSCVMSLRSSSMSIDVRGSRPLLGSSQKRYFGIEGYGARYGHAFCMPPEISAGYLFSAPVRFTRSRQNIARSRCWALLMSVNIIRGNITLPSTVSESKSADPWKKHAYLLAQRRYFLAFHAQKVAPVEEYLALSRAAEGPRAISGGTGLASSRFGL